VRSVVQLYPGPFSQPLADPIRGNHKLKILPYREVSPLGLVSDISNELKIEQETTGLKFNFDSVGTRTKNPLGTRPAACGLGRPLA
jgi:hypothetical protein